MYLGSLCVPFGVPRAPFGMPLGSFCPSLVLLLTLFGGLWLPLGWLGMPFAVLWAPLASQGVPLGHLLDFVESWTSLSEPMCRISAACAQIIASRNSSAASRNSSADSADSAEMVQAGPFWT